ncbi:MAG TPA: hypothetical protein VLZ32_00785 [Rhodanobacter sp.]|nr:hypothetical protein [Rhodanobacter sp.]
MSEVSTLRLYLMRAVFLLNFVVLGSDVWPALLNHPEPWDPVKSAAFSFWAALSLLSLLGLRYPVRMLPLLLFQLTYKIIWLLAVAFPQWSDFQSVELTRIMLFGLIIDSLVIPWPFVFRNYVKAHGDHWKRRSRQEA